MEVQSARQAVARQPAFLPYALLLLVQLLLASLLQVASVPYGLIVSEVLFFGLPPLLWVMGSNFKWRDFLRLRRPAPRLVATGALLGAANFLVAGTLQVLTRRLLPSDFVKQFDVSHIFAGAGSAELVAVMAALAVAAPVCEEIAFRGYLQSVLRARMSAGGAIAVSAVLFAALHMDPVGFAARVELGALFGALVLWSGSLWPAIAAHAVNNLIASVLFISALGEGSAQSQTEPALLPTVAGGLGALVLVAALVSVFRTWATARPPSSPDFAQRADAEASEDFSPARIRRPLLLAAAGFAAATALFLALDWRGAVANYIDLSTPTSEISHRVADAGEREGLEERLRLAHRRAREGTLPLGGYRALRKSLLGTAQQRAAQEPLTGQQIQRAFGESGRAVGGTGG